MVTLIPIKDESFIEQNISYKFNQYNTDKSGMLDQPTNKMQFLQKIKRDILMTKEEE